MKISKLTKKIWLTAFMILITFTGIAFLNLDILITLLPIIIPSGILTLGMPPYLIIKQVLKDMNQIEQKSKKENREKEIEFNQNKQRIQEEIELIKRENFYDESQEIESENIQQKRKIIKKGTMY